MGNIAIVVGMLLCAVAGWFVRDWQGQREIIGIVQQESERRGRLLVAHLETERALVDLQQRQAGQRAQLVQQIEAAPQLADVPLPADIRLLLDVQIARARAASRAVPSGGMPGPLEPARDSD